MRTSTLLVSVLFVFACSAEDREPPSDMTAEQPENLQIQPRENWLVVETEHGFSVSTQESQSARIPEQVAVRLAGHAEFPEGELPLQKNINGHTVFYRIDNDPGGSAGLGYRLTARFESDRGTVILEQYTQSEFEPDFSLAWMVIEKLR